MALIGPEYAGGLNTGVVPVNILGQDNIDPTVLQIEVNANHCNYKHRNFYTLRAQINGFGQINPVLIKSQILQVLV